MNTHSKRNTRELALESGALRLETRIQELKGFTLIELLTVVSIISVILAILLPATNRARSVAKRIACQSKLKNCAIAWNLYLDDNAGRFFQGVNASTEYGGWQGERLKAMSPIPRPLNPYVSLPLAGATEHDAQIFACPADRGGVPGYAAHSKAYQFLGTSYQTNIFLIGQTRVLILNDAFMPLHEEINKRLASLNICRIDNPARLLLIGDYGWINQWKPVLHPRADWKELAEWHQRSDWHNLAFLDGHIKFLRIKKGLYVGDQYTVLPFEKLYGMAREAQGE